MDKAAAVTMATIQVVDADADKDVRISAVAAIVTNIVILMVAVPILVRIVKHQDPTITLKLTSTT